MEKKQEDGSTDDLLVPRVEVKTKHSHLLMKWLRKVVIHRVTVKTIVTLPKPTLFPSKDKSANKKDTLL